MTPARFKILQELKTIKELITTFNCSCNYNTTTQNDPKSNTTDLLFTINMLQILFMIGIIIALMCNFYSINEPKWREIAAKAVAFGAIVTFWPIYACGVCLVSFYFKCIKSDEIKAEDLKSKVLLKTTKTAACSAVVPPMNGSISLTPTASPVFKRKARNVQFSIPKSSTLPWNRQGSSSNHAPCI